MAPIKLASMLTRFSHKIILVLTHSFLEWVLILLLISNSIVTCMIRKFALYFNLKQPCILCSTIDHLLDPTKKPSEFYKSLLCENHATEISHWGQMCEECCLSKSKNVYLNQKESSEKVLRKTHCFSFRERLVISEIQEEKSREIGCYKVDEFGNHSGSDCEPQILSDAGSFYLREAAEQDSFDVDEVDDHAGGKQIQISRNEDGTHSNEEPTYLLLSADGKRSLLESTHHGRLMDEKEQRDHNIFIAMKHLKSEFEAEQKARNDLYTELEAERNAAAIAANQTMTMITRLQEEKAAMQMEALQYQRVMEEQAEYDQEALRLLNDLLAKRDTEKQQLQNELHKAKQKELMMVQNQTEDSNSDSSCSIDNDSDVLSIDLNHPCNKVEDSGFSLMECSKQWGEIEGSLDELEEERMLIIKQLKELEEKLQTAEKKEENKEKKEEIVLNSEMCSQEVNLVSSGFGTSITSESYPKTMASVARKLLDCVGYDDEYEMEDGNGGEGTSTRRIMIGRVESESESGRGAIEKEMDHVYGRLQAIEADTEFLRHCIGSVNKGSEGLNMLQEILQHLRALRDADICF